jgi:hypothetical protein
MSFNMPAFAADELKNPQNITFSIPEAPETTFRLENVLDEYMVTIAAEGYQDTYRQFPFYTFFLDGEGSVTADKDISFGFYRLLLYDDGSPITVPRASIELFESGKKIHLRYGIANEITSLYADVYADGSIGAYGEEVVARLGFLLYQSLEYGFESFGDYELRPISELAVTPSVPALTAKPTASTVLVNSQNIAFDAYNIEDSNYFKLRDLAFVLNGTEKQFEVGWNGANNVITLTSKQPYTAAGGEMTDKGAGDKTPTPTSSKIYLDGKEVTFTAYNIGGNNYFKLRDIGAAFDFGVTWDGAKNTIVIDTGIGYTPE